MQTKRKKSSADPNRLIPLLPERLNVQSKVKRLRSQIFDQTLEVRFRISDAARVSDPLDFQVRTAHTRP